MLNPLKKKRKKKKRERESKSIKVVEYFSLIMRNITLFNEMSVYFNVKSSNLLEKECKF